ncbi:MAG: GTPase HflX [Myxococcota bacterium]|nr:GTPase HflX [Myxococcota bacterium]
MPPGEREPGDPQRVDAIQIFGNTNGLKASQVRQLERLGRRRLAPEHLLTQEFARFLSALTHETGRQVGVLVDRRGAVTHVMVGDARSITLPDWGRMRAGRGRLRGLRCIHTHVDEEPLTRDDLTDLALLRLDAMVAIGTRDDGLPGLAHVASLRPANRDGTAVDLMDPVPPAQLQLDFREWIGALEEELARQTRTREVTGGERAVLVSVTAGRSKDEVAGQVAELKELARSAGVEVVELVTQQRAQVDRKTLLGAGRLEDLVVRAFQQDVDLVIFDQNLTSAQARNLGERLDLRVIDRAQLILDIFAQHARTRDGKLQVELAQLRYRLPRLSQRADLSLSRLAGGIGGRGPGEQKLEIDRRRTRERIRRLERELEKLRRQRSARRKQRERRGLPVLSIVGYTNAGKSTLLRALTQTDVFIADQMFATLDPTSRRLRFPRDREVIVTDTVGFIRDLPRDLVAAFRATLEEISQASLLLHVVDVASPDFERHIAAVREVLDEIDEGRTPEILVFNQIDRLPPGVGAAIAERHGGVAVSALERRGFEALLTRAGETLWESGNGAHTIGATDDGFDGDRAASAQGG